MKPFSVEKAIQSLEPFSPVNLAYVDDHVLRCAVVRGEFPWHRHSQQDELFLCYSGKLTVETRTDNWVLGPGEGVVVQQGVEHRVLSGEGAIALVMERQDTQSRGD